MKIDNRKEHVTSSSINLTLETNFFSFFPLSVGWHIMYFCKFNLTNICFVFVFFVLKTCYEKLDTVLGITATVFPLIEGHSYHKCLPETELTGKEVSHRLLGVHIHLSQL